MADTDTETLPNGTGALSEEDERMKQRPADIDADVREMERRKRVEALMSSRLFREELERVLDQQMHEGADAPLLQRIKEMVGGRLHTGSFRGPSCVLPINDIRGIEGVGYEKGEKILRCKLAALYRLVDLFGWTQNGVASQLTARLNTAVEQLLISPRGLMPHEVTASSLLKVDMQGTVIDSGTTNYGVHKAGFSVHAAVHAARPDVRCVLHLRSPPVLAISATKQGLLPLCTEAALIGDVAYHRVPTGILDNEERDKIVRVLGPSCKILFLRSQGALCCGSTLEEAFYHAKHLHTAADVQLKLATVPRDQLAVMDDEERKEIYDASRAEGAAESNKWRAGGEEFEALMRMLDNAGFRTGYIYRNPLIKNDVPRPKNDVEVPPAVSSLGYLLEEEEMYRQGLWKKGQGKTGERTRWLNSPNVYQKVEVLETGTNDPKKITKWVDANNEEWVQDGSPAHSSTPMKIDAALQFVPKNTNPKEFKALQQQIKDNRRADKISAGPQSHILEGVTWDEANRLNAEDASATHAGDHVVLVGAASKGIIQRGYQHNATVYSAPYARNPFEHVSERDLDEYTRRVTGQNNYDTDLSESEAISAAQMTSPVSETEEESRDEHRVLRIETKQAPMRSQPEVVLSDGVGQNPKLTPSINPSSANKKRDYPRCPNFESLILKYESPKDDPKCKVNLKTRYDSEPTNTDAVEIYNPGSLSGRSSLNSVPSIEWDVKKRSSDFRSQSLPRKLGRNEQQQRYYRSCSHAGFINSYIKNPEPLHYHVPKCRKCGSFNSSYDWEITKKDLKSSGKSSIWHSYENIHNSCLREGDRKVLAICDVVRVKEMDMPVFAVDKEFVHSEEYNEDCYLENTYLSNSTVVENANLDGTLVEAAVLIVKSKENSEIPLNSSDKAVNNTDKVNGAIKPLDKTIVCNDDKHVSSNEVKREDGIDENGIYRAECIYIETSGESCKSSHQSPNSPESKAVTTDVDYLVTLGINKAECVEQIHIDSTNEQLKTTKNVKDKNDMECVSSEVKDETEIDSSVYRAYHAVLKELKYRIDAIAEHHEIPIDFTVDNEEGEYLNFTNELDFDKAVYDSPVRNLIRKDIQDYLIPLGFYSDSPSKFNTSSGKALETIAEETKVSDSSNESVKDSIGEKESKNGANVIPSKMPYKDYNLNINDDESSAKVEINTDLDNINILMEDRLVKDSDDNAVQAVEFSIPRISVTDLSGLEVCENFKISIESSTNEVPSFDSTAEFEKIEAVADIISVLLKRVSITLVNKCENDFYKTVDEALKIKHKGVKFFDLAGTNESDFNKVACDVDLQQEDDNLVKEDVTRRQNSPIQCEELPDEQFVAVPYNDKEKNCAEEIFSIVEIVDNIEQNIVGGNLTVLSEDSDLDPKTHPYKVCESIVYHILCVVFYEIKRKYKRANDKTKAVVTVADSEDILFTALPIWDIAYLSEKADNKDEMNEIFKLPTDTSSLNFSDNQENNKMDPNQMKEVMLVPYNDNLFLNDQTANKELGIILSEDNKDTESDYKALEMVTNKNLSVRSVVRVGDEVDNTIIVDIKNDKIITKAALSQVEDIKNIKDALRKDMLSEQECLMVADDNIVTDDNCNIFSQANDIVPSVLEADLIAVEVDNNVTSQKEITKDDESLSENKIETIDVISLAELETNYVQGDSKSEHIDNPVGIILESVDAQAQNCCNITDDDDVQVKGHAIGVGERDSSESPPASTSKEHEDAIKDIKKNFVEEINMIVSKITDGANKFDREIVGADNSGLSKYETTTNSTFLEPQIITAENNTTNISLKPDAILCDHEMVADDFKLTAKDSTSLEIPISNLNPNAIPFCMKVCDFEFEAPRPKEYHEYERYLNLNTSAMVQQDVLNIVEDVLEVVSSIDERYSKEYENPISPVDRNKSELIINVAEQNLEQNVNYLDEQTEIGVPEEKKSFKIITLDVSKSFEESRKLSPTKNYQNSNASSPRDKCIVLDVYDMKSYAKDEQDEYVTEINIDIKGYPELVEYNDCLNASNEDNAEPCIDKNDRPKFVDLVTRDDDGSIDSVTYNSHILQTIVENLLQDVVSEFVINDNVCENVINKEIQEKDFSNADANTIVVGNIETIPIVKEQQHIGDTGVDSDADFDKNETFILDSNKDNNTTINSAELEACFADMAYQSCSKTDLDQTYVLGTDLAKDNSELTEEPSYFDTAFCEDTMLTNQSSPYKNNSPIFTSCDESPIKSSNTAYLEDSVLYEKCDEISPFDKTTAVLSMSQSVNAGGVKYWLSFDDSFTEEDDKKTIRGRKNRDLPSFYSFDTIDNLTLKGSSHFDSNILKDKTSDSTVYVTASCSKSKNDAWTSCSVEPSTSKDQSEKRLIFDCSKQTKKRSRRREYHTWPPYDESLFYRIISKFRMSESFDFSELDNIDFRL